MNCGISRQDGTGHAGSAAVDCRSDDDNDYNRIIDDKQIGKKTVPEVSCTDRAVPQGQTTVVLLQTNCVTECSLAEVTVQWKIFDLQVLTFRAIVNKVPVYQQECRYIHSFIHFFKINSDKPHCRYRDRTISSLHCEMLESKLR